MTPVPSPARSRGVALPMALIVLVAMMLAAVSLVRSVDTATLVAGNLTFKQRATHAADEGIRQAYLWLRDTTINNPVALNNSDIGNGYYSTQHGNDPNWDPTVNWPAASVTLPIDGGGNTVSYVIHRLCTQPAVAYNAPNQECATYSGGNIAGQGGSQSVDAPEFIGIVYVYYRVTARAEGPRGTRSFVQAMMLSPAS